MNNNDQELVDGEPLDVATRAMQSTAVSRVPDDVIAATENAMQPDPVGAPWFGPKLQSAALALVTACVLVLVALAFRKDTRLTLHVVAENARATKTMRAVLVDPNEPGTLFVSGTRTRFEGENAIVVSDSATKKEIMLDLENKTAYRLHGAHAGVVNLYELFDKLAKSPGAPIPDYVSKDGVRLPGHAGQTTLNLGGEELSVTAKIWSDAKTKLPVRIEIQPTEDGGEIVLAEQIEFGMELEDELFDQTIPADFQVVGLDPSELKEPPTEQEAKELTLMPGVGIGKVKFGMSYEEIVAIMGEPEITQHGTYLTYASNGVQLILVGREPDKLGMIIANPFDAAALTRNEFAGSTDKGIQIGSTRQEVIDAYGKPDPPVPGGAPESIGYSDFGIGFTCLDDKVVQIILTRLH